VRRNVEALGGTITLENKPSGGLRARITLPLDERWSETRLRA
jgi:signal transduction histidine kinase